MHRCFQRFNVDLQGVTAQPAEMSDNLRAANWNDEGGMYYTSQETHSSQHMLPDSVPPI